MGAVLAHGTRREPGGFWELHRRVQFSPVSWADSGACQYARAASAPRTATRCNNDCCSSGASSGRTARSSRAEWWLPACAFAKASGFLSMHAHSRGVAASSLTGMQLVQGYSGRTIFGLRSLDRRHSSPRRFALTDFFKPATARISVISLWRSVSPASNCPRDGPRCGTFAEMIRSPRCAANARTRSTQSVAGPGSLYTVNDVGSGTERLPVN